MFCCYIVDCTVCTGPVSSNIFNFHRNWCINQFFLPFHPQVLNLAMFNYRNSIIRHYFFSFLQRIILMIQVKKNWSRVDSGPFVIAGLDHVLSFPLMMLLPPAPLTWTAHISLQLCQLRAVRTPCPEVPRCSHKTTAVSAGPVPAAGMFKMDWIKNWNYT